MAKILVAASHEPGLIVGRILAGHELLFADTMAQAEQLLRKNTFGLIICTIVFDESKMFDLLRLAKSSSEWKQVPFVVARARSHILSSPTSLRSVAFTCGTLGAAAFLDIADYKLEPEREM